MKPELQGVEVEPLRSGDDDLAVEHGSRRQLIQEDLVELGKVTIEWSQIAALDEDVVLGAKHNRAESVPLRFVQVAAACGQLFGQLCQHRLDGRGESARRGRFS